MLSLSPCCCCVVAKALTPRHCRQGIVAKASSPQSPSPSLLRRHFLVIAAVTIGSTLSPLSLSPLRRRCHVVTVTVGSTLSLLGQRFHFRVDAVTISVVTVSIVIVAIAS